MPPTPPSSLSPSLSPTAPRGTGMGGWVGDREVEVGHKERVRPPHAPFLSIALSVALTVALSVALSVAHGPERDPPQKHSVGWACDAHMLQACGLGSSQVMDPYSQDGGRTQGACPCPPTPPFSPPAAPPPLTAFAPPPGARLEVTAVGYMIQGT